MCFNKEVEKPKSSIVEMSDPLGALNQDDANTNANTTSRNSRGGSAAIDHDAAKKRLFDYKPFSSMDSFNSESTPQRKTVTNVNSDFIYPKASILVGDGGGDAKKNGKAESGSNVSRSIDYDYDDEEQDEVDDDDEYYEDEYEDEEDEENEEDEEDDDTDNDYEYSNDEYNGEYI